MKDRVLGKIGAINLPVVIGGIVTIAVVVLLSALIINALTKNKAVDEVAEGPIPSVSVTPAETTPTPVKSVQGANTKTQTPKSQPARPATGGTQPTTTTTTVRTVTTEDVVVKLNPRCTKMRARWNPEDPYQVSFTTEGEADGATVVNYQWDFDGNGSWDSEEGRVENSIGHRYSDKKSYTVKSRVRDSQGRWSEICEMGIDLNDN